MPFKDPAVLKQYQQRYQRRCREDPNYRTRSAAYQRAYQQKAKFDPERKAKLAATKSRYYFKNRDRLLQYGRDRMAKIRSSPEQKAKQRKWSFAAKLRKFKITPDQYQKLFELQKGRCAICRVKFDELKHSRKACIDHCGKAGHVRAILCTNCNSGIAMFGHSVSRTLRAAEYLSSEILFNGQ